jgi:mycothiol synthase
VLVGTDSDGNIVGYGQIKWWQEEDGSIIYVHSGTVDPTERRKGHGSSIVDELENRIRELSSGHDEKSPKYIGSNSSETNVGKSELLGKRGYDVVHSMVEMEFVDQSKLPDMDLPEGFTLRESATLDEKRKVYKAYRRANDGAFGMPLETEDDFEDFLSDNPDSSKWRVLWESDNVAGFVVSEIRENGSAEIMEVAVAPEYQKRGFGSLLMADSINSLQAEGVDLIRLHTGAEGKTGGRHLYDKIGFQALKEHHRHRKQLQQDKLDTK